MIGHQIYSKLGIFPQGHHFPCLVTYVGNVHDFIHSVKLRALMILNFEKLVSIVANLHWTFEGSSLVTRISHSK